MKEAWLFQGAVVPVDTETTQALVAEIKRLIDVVGGMALECPNCEYHKNRAARWRAEAYAQAGHDVIERPWAAVDDEDYIKALELCDFDKVAAFEFFESKLKDKNE